MGRHSPGAEHQAPRDWVSATTLVQLYEAERENAKPRNAQYIWPPHPASECVNAQCRTHFPDLTRPVYNAPAGPL